jgi:hypothetical protein
MGGRTITTDGIFLDKNDDAHQLIHWQTSLTKPIGRSLSNMQYGNHLPQTAHGQTPVKYSRGIKSMDPNFLQRCRVWDHRATSSTTRLQDGKRIPKFTSVRDLECTWDCRINILRLSVSPPIYRPEMLTTPVPRRAIYFCTRNRFRRTL